MSKTRTYTVTELANLLQKTLEDNPTLANVWVRGEISNCKIHSSGHVYFSLRDAESSLKAVMFRSRAKNLAFTLADGMDCLVRGYISLYAKDTMLQLYTEEIIPAGVGLQQLALEELKKKLQGRGYFAQERKRPLPKLPKGVGVVTSPTGAVIRDICQVIGRRYPGMPVILYPASVQGDKALPSMIEGIKALGARSEIDVIILARGGGSKEDLSLFNHELLAEAIFNCPIPLISAVGHEVDYTIADLVADHRAATPSVAGELAVPVKFELLKIVKKYDERLCRALENRLEKERMRLAFLANSHVMKRPERLINRAQEELAFKETALQRLFSELLNEKKTALVSATGKLQALSPLATLSRGYSICRNKEGKIITEAGQVKIEEEIEIHLLRGKLNCLVAGKEENS